MNNLILATTGYKCDVTLPVTNNIIISYFGKYNNSQYFILNNIWFYWHRENGKLIHITPEYYYLEYFHSNFNRKLNIWNFLEYIIEDPFYLVFHDNYQICRKFYDEANIILEKIFQSFLPYDIINVIGEFFKLEYYGILHNNVLIFILYCNKPVKIKINEIDKMNIYNEKININIDLHKEDLSKYRVRRGAFVIYSD